MTMMGVRANEEMTPAPDNKRQRLLPSPDSITATADSELGGSPSVSTTPTVNHQLSTEAAAQQPAATVPAIPVGLIADYILPFVPSRKDWNNLSMTSRDLSLQCRSSPVPPPWPDDMVINLRGTPWPTSLAISSPVQSEWIAFGTDSGSIRLWNAYSGQFPVLEEHTHTILHVEFSPSDPNLLLSCSEDGSVRLWNLPQRRQYLEQQQKCPPHESASITSQLVGDFKDVHREAGGYTTASFCPTGELLACASWRSISPDPVTGRSSYISIWNVNTGYCLRQWGTGGTEYAVNRHNNIGEFNTQGFQTILFHPDYHKDKKYVITQYNVRMDSVQVWDLNADDSESERGEDNADSGSDDQSDNASPDTTTKIPPATIIDPYDDYRHQRGPIYSKPPPVLLVPCNYKRGARTVFLAKIESNLVSFWTVPFGKFLGHAVNSTGVHRIISMAISPHGDVLATCNIIGDARLWKIKENETANKRIKGAKNGGKLFRTLSLPDCSNIRCMAFTNNGRVLVCVGMTGTIHFCNSSVA